MDFQKKGWLKQYIQTRNYHTLHREFERVTTLKATDQQHEQLLYELIQPTGLLYGYPAQLPFEYEALLEALNTEKLPAQDKNKIILLESLLYSALTSERYQQLESEIDVADAFLEAAYRVGAYYKSVYQNLDTQYRSLFLRRERRGMDLTEYILDSRTNYATREGKFWTVFVNSSLLFVDVLFFHPWIAQHQSPEAAQAVVTEHENIRMLLLKTMIVAAYANQTIEKEERQLVDYYLEAALLSEENRERSYALLEKGLSIEDIDTTSVSSLVLKKYLLELAVLVVSADNIITESEESFIDTFCQKLGLPAEKAEASILTVESFMYAHWQEIGYPRHRDEPDALRQHLLARLKKIGRTYQKQLKKLVKQDEPLYQLLQAARQSQLPTHDRKKLRQGLLTAFGQLPTFTPDTLPASFLTYSVLLEVTPEV